MKNLVKYQLRKSCELRPDFNYDNCRVHIKKIINLNDHESNLGSFDVNFCSDCKLGLTEPYPTEETCGFLYDSKTTSDFDVMNNTLIDKIKDFLSVRLLKKIAKNDRISRVMDYSTGNGRFAISASKAFPKAIIDAVDYQLTPPYAINNCVNESVGYLNVNELNDTHGLYDLIILRHVLEHTYHPVELLRDLSKRLAVDGQIYVEVPNLDSGCARIFGKNWKLYYVPRHIFHYTTTSLKEIVISAGMNVEIGRNEIPLMGNTIAIITGKNQANILIQILGIIFHPLQLLIEACFRSSTCINAKCRIK